MRFRNRRLVRLVKVYLTVPLRNLLVVGAHSILYHCKKHSDQLRIWAAKLLETKPFKLVAVALANKLARIAFAVMSSGSTYRTA